MKLLNDSDDSGGRNGKIHQEVGFFPSVPSLVCCTLPILTCKGLPRYPILPSSYPPIIPPSLLSHLGLLPSVSHRYPIGIPSSHRGSHLVSPSHSISLIPAAWLLVLTPGRPHCRFSDVWAGRSSRPILLTSFPHALSSPSPN